jgi:hypothetical protein
MKLTLTLPDKVSWALTAVAAKRQMSAEEYAARLIADTVFPSKVTIYDVAKKAKVTGMTVSKALRDKKGVSDEVRARIKAIAEEMGLRPNIAAGSLRSRQS